MSKRKNESEQNQNQKKLDLKSNLTFCYTCADSFTDDRSKVKFDEIFRQEGFVYKTLDEVTELFDSNPELCKHWTLKHHIKPAIMSKYFTLCLFDDEVMKCIMNIDIKFYDNDFDMDIADDDYKIIIEHIIIINYCCVEGSKRSRELLHKLKSLFKDVPIDIVSSNNSYWKNIGATEMSTNYYRLGGKRRTKRKKYAKSKRKMFKLMR